MEHNSCHIKIFRVRSSYDWGYQDFRACKGLTTGFWPKSSVRDPGQRERQRRMLVKVNKPIRARQTRVIWSLTPREW